MADDVKICPECGAEFFAHATTCNKCEVTLIPPGQKPQKRTLPQAQGDGGLVAIMNGPIDRLRELSTELDFIGIENKVLNSGGACSTDSYSLFVPASLANVALGAIEDFKIRIYPELRQAEERFLNGQCPACGADVSSNPAECPDCGLNLSGSGGGECSDDSCGSCGGH